MLIALAASILLATSPLAVQNAPAKAPASPTAAAKGTIVDTAVAAGNFKTLVAAVKAAGLVETLNGQGPFTVFAPTDAAFAKLPAGTLEMLLKPENKAKLAAILTYHVVPGSVKAADVVKLKFAGTVNGQRIAGERLMTSDKVSVPSRLRLTRCNSLASARVASALRNETSSRSGEAGLTTKSAAPARITETTLSMPPCAVWIMTGVSRPAWRMRASTPRPSRSGITRSSTTQSIRVG